MSSSDAKPIQVIGNYVSPYVRKVLACLAIKGVAYEIDPIVPFFGDERFEAISPLRRIPVLIDGDVVITDSTVICEYIEERFDGPALLPASPADRAKARWLEEFADSRLGDLIIWRLFNQLAIRRAIWGEETDQAVVEQTLGHDLPAALDYLEGQLPADGFLFGGTGLADISVAVFFRNAAFVRFGIDAERWPRTAGLVARVLDAEPLKALRPFEEAILRNPVAEHRRVLGGLGAPLSAESVGGDVARRGIMPTG